MISMEATTKVSLRTVCSRYKFSVLAAALAVIVLGCTPSGSGILGKQESSAIDEDPTLKNTPFAYELAADTISYNSCVMQQTDSNIHGLKIGVSEGFADNLGTGAVRAGIKLRTEFLNYVGRTFSPEYPSNTITPEQIMRILNTSYSVFNSKAYPQLAVRRRSNNPAVPNYTVVPDLIVTAADTSASPPRDAAVFPYNLASGYVGYSLAKGIVFNSSGIAISEGSRVYNLSDSPDPIPIEGSFKFNAIADSSAPMGTATFPTEPFGTAEIHSDNVREQFNLNNQLLTATFGGTSATTGSLVDDIANDSINHIKRPYKNGTSEFDLTKAYGRGYYLKFESGTVANGWPNSRLTKVSEIDLFNGGPIGSATLWNCESFTIAHPSHWNNNKASNPVWIHDTTQVEPNCSPLLASDTATTSAECDLVNAPPVGDTVQQCAVKRHRVEQIKSLRRHYAVSDWNIGLMFPAQLKSGYVPPDRRNLSLCVSPKTGSCYLPTFGIMPSDPTKDVGIQYDRGQDCYQTKANYVGPNRDLIRQRGRCAHFASICIRDSNSF